MEFHAAEFGGNYRMWGGVSHCRGAEAAAEGKSKAYQLDDG
jgi:hypothetical protein